MINSQDLVPSKVRVLIVSAASQLPQDEDRAVTRWSLDELVDRVMEALPKSSISRSTIWRVLEEIDLRPHKSEYWLNSHDADFEAKASDVCQLYRQAQAFLQQGRLVISCGKRVIPARYQGQVLQSHTTAQVTPRNTTDTVGIAGIMSV